MEGAPWSLRIKSTQQLHLPQKAASSFPDDQSAFLYTPPVALKDESGSTLRIIVCIKTCRDVAELSALLSVVCGQIADPIRLPDGIDLTL